MEPDPRLSASQPSLYSKRGGGTSEQGHIPRQQIETCVLESRPTADDGEAGWLFTSCPFSPFVVYYAHSQ